MENTTIREKTESYEKLFLSKFSSFSANSLGREFPEEKCNIRTDFQRDRDRIIHSKAFRRLKQKTQVFLSPEGDHYRTRLTHTLEVAQIARTIARALRLNEDLTEAIALAHDLGHTPFGHAGEKALNELFNEGFRHYEQSIRVVKKLEKDGKGLNLCYEVLDGIINHTKGPLPNTLEGQIVRISDRIAYVNHDIDDALRANILTLRDLPSGAIKILGDTTSKRINSLVSSLVNNSKDNYIKMSDEIQAIFDELHTFMYQNVYYSPYAKREEKKVPMLIEELFTYFVYNDDKLPDEYKLIAEKEGIERAVCDFIAGMTDQYAIHLFDKLFVPKAWS